MKLYLSSYRLGDRKDELVGMFGEDKSVAIIPNALDVFPDGERKDLGLRREIEDLQGLGLRPEILNLRDYFNNRNDLSLKLSNYNAVWVLGGNCFVLRKAYQKSGLDDWLMNNRDRDDFVYSGYSAGICVLAPSLEGIHLADEPNDVHRVYGEEVIWNGVGFLDFLPVPHFDSDHKESPLMNNVVAYMKEKQLPYKTLKDGEVLIFQGVDNEPSREIRASLNKETLS